MTFNSACTKNLYAILGILPSSDKKTIREAYKKLAKKYHPDTNHGNKESEKKFKDINYAYEILSNDAQRAEYDARNGFFQKRHVNYSNPYKANQNYKKQTSYTKSCNNTKCTNQEKTVKKEKNFSDNFSDFVSEVFSATDKQPVSGSDINLDLTINFDEALKGTKRRINVIYSQCCPICYGKKFLNGNKCEKCNGTGEISSYKCIDVNIQKYTKQGDILTFKGEGNKGKYGGRNGNLNIKINIEKNEIFRFKNNDVLSDIYISAPEAALGTNINIPTIDGYVNMKVPPETSSGQKFKLHGIGIFDKENNIRGNHIVTVFIKIPKNLTLQEKKLYEKLLQLRKEEDND